MQNTFKNVRIQQTMIIFLGIITLMGSACKRTTESIPYEKRLSQIRTDNEKVRTFYQNATSPKERQRVDRELAPYLFERCMDLFDYWYGTPWDFNGITETPNKGKIACGYFVTTILRDLGFDVQRVKMAQQASEKIIKTLVSETYIKRFSGMSVKKFIGIVEEMGQGIYIVGLDTHVGFLVVHTEGVDFVHAARTGGRRVRSENPLKANVMVKSKYRIVGKILDNKELLQRWLQNEPFIVK